MDHKERLKAIIREAFTEAVFPGKDALVEGTERDEVILVKTAFQDKKDWRMLTPEFLAQAPDGYSSALNFFSKEAFRFYLPGYLLGDIDGKMNWPPDFHLTSGLIGLSPTVYAQERFAGFTAKECQAIIRYLDFKLYDDSRLSSSRNIQRALASYWYPRAYRDESKERKHKRNSAFQPNPSIEERPSVKEIKTCYYGYQAATIFPESVILADSAKQHFTVILRAYYVDILKQCRDCHCEFIFFATEQQYWYETLGFFIDADCVRCPNCRTSDQTLRRRFKSYSKTVRRKKLNDHEFVALLEDALFLYEAGMIKSDQQVRRLRNQAKKRMPEAEIVMKLNTALSGKK